MDSLDTNALASALKQRGLFDKAREVLRQYAEQQQQNPGLPSRDVFDLLADAGLVNAVSEAMLESGVDPATLKRITTVERVAPAATIDEQRTVRPAERLAAEPALPASAASSPPARAIRPVSRFAASVADPSRPQLLIRFGKGKAFVPPQALSGDIEVAGPTSATAGDVDAAMAMEAAQGVKRAYVLHALCCGQRFQSDPVPVSLEPDFSVSSPAAVLGPAVTDDGVPTAPSASTEPHFVVDLQPMLKKESPSEAGGSVGAGTLSRTTAAAFTRVDTLPVTRKILQGTTLESSGLHLILTLVTDKTNKGNNKGSKSNRVDSDSSTAATTADVSVDIVASHSLDWRTIVSSESGYLTSLVPLTPAGPGPHPSAADGSGNRIPVGLLNLQLYLRPLQPLNEIVPRYDAEFTLSRSLALQRDSSQAFLGYAKRWWREYKEVHPSFRDRPVKIFGESEKGEFLPVCSYVTPLSAGRLLESPHHAARFVALIPFKQEETLGSSSSSSFSSSASPSGRKELWYSPHVTLALRQGDVEAHAVLLCSLFCGFGLEAYCASGTRIDAEGVEHEYCWVVTRYATTVPAPASSSAGGGGGDEDDGADRTVTVAKVTFWDPLTGQASSPLSGASAASAGGSSSSSSGAVASGFRYYRISSLFNHCSFYANHALNDSVAAVRWGDWNDHTQWKSMEPAMLALVPRAPCPPLLPPSLDPLTVSDAVEAALRIAVESYRHRVRRVLLESCRAQGRVPPAWTNDGGNSNSEDKLALSTAAVEWDADLEHRLQMALSSYELERTTGVITGGDEFASAIRNYVPKGFAFRGFPVLFNHCSPKKMLATLLATEAAREIIEAPSDAHTVFAAKVRVHVYPEDTTACWVMLASCQPVVDVEPAVSGLRLSATAASER